MSIEWTDEGLILGARAHGEQHAIVELFTKAHGRAAGLVHGGQSRRVKPVLQPGNLVEATFKARTDHQLGHFAPLELSVAYAGRFLEDAAALAGLSSAIALVRGGAAERQVYPGLYEALMVLAEALGEGEIWPALYTRFELGLLASLGYALDLSACALTGATTDLAFVSPKSGRAASAEAGAPFADKLFRLPPFLTNANAPIEPGDVADAFALAGYFLERRVFDRAGTNLPASRTRLIEALGFRGML